MKEGEEVGQLPWEATQRLLLGLGISTLLSRGERLLRLV